MQKVEDIVAKIQLEGGKITRGDVLDVLNFYQDKDRENENVSNFLDMVGSLTPENKRKILDDLESYPVSYQR